MSDRGPLSDGDRAALEVWAAQDPRLRAGSLCQGPGRQRAPGPRAAGLGTDCAPSARPAARAAASQIGRAPSACPGRGPAGRRLSGGGGRLWRPRPQGSRDHRQGRHPPRPADRWLSRDPESLDTAKSATAFDGKIRRVDLLRGEALFDVAKDTARRSSAVAAGECGCARSAPASRCAPMPTAPGRGDRPARAWSRSGAVPRASPMRLSAEHAVRVGQRRRPVAHERRPWPPSTGAMCHGRVARSTWTALTSGAGPGRRVRPLFRPPHRHRRSHDRQAPDDRPVLSFQ
ncbi:hypothetical protein ACRAWD_02860 [Caulobacter segnis]